MFDVQLLMDRNTSNSKYKIKLVNKKYLYTIHDSFLNFGAVLRFIEFTNHMFVKLPIVIELKNVSIDDKLCYVLLECVCQYLISERNMRISISFLGIEKGILIEGITSSPLQILSSKNTSIDRELYMKRFHMDVYKRHYRRLIRTDENDEGIAASKISSEIEMFLKNLHIEQEYIKDVTEVMGELIDNGLDHSDADCLIDVDVTSNHIKRGDPNGIYYGVNIAILSLSNNLIGDKIKHFFNTIENNMWYDRLRIAYDKHMPFWDKDYIEDDFFAMAAFQNKITTRSMDSNTGGTGLTQLISVLESKSDAYNCYMVSGRRILRFQQELLKQDSCGWVGFNIEHDFVNYLPRKDSFCNSPLFFPGVAYNLNFILKKENDNE